MIAAAAIVAITIRTTPPPTRRAHTIHQLKNQLAQRVEVLLDELPCTPPGIVRETGRHVLEVGVGGVVGEGAGVGHGIASGVVVMSTLCDVSAGQKKWCEVWE